MQEFKLIVAGGREFIDYDVCALVLNDLAYNELSDDAVSLVSGMARGADSLAVRFAQENNVKLYKFPANWETHGKAAGYMRNTEMAKFADGLLAFWDGKSRGTRHMIAEAERQGLRVWIHYY